MGAAGGSTPQIMGILNVTRDSFSDGGRYLEPAWALAHARQLLADGADIIDVGAESTHPDAESVPAEEEIRRLTPVVQKLRELGARVSVDTYKPAVMRHVLRLGVEFINDVTALRDPAAVAAVRDSQVKLILMHSTATGPQAERRPVGPQGMVERILAFFERRIAELEQAGIRAERLILDPGMGLFLSSDPQTSVRVLRELSRLSVLGRPILVSVSRKGFLADLLGPPHRLPAQRGAATLAAELWAAQKGVAYIRTHDVQALRDALRIWQLLQAVPQEIQK
jgi:dihydropteroate synthase type 2